MKSLIRVLASALLLSSLFIFNGCKKEDDDVAPPANLITSSTIDVSLTWLTGSTAAQAPIDADLDLRLYSKNIITVDDLPIGWSENTDAFETFNISESTGPTINLTDGDYYLKVLMYENFAGKAITFTLTVTGGGKEIKATGNFADTKMASNGNYAGPGTSETVRTAMKLTKSGNKYTITNL